MKKNNNVKFVEVVNGCRIRVKETKRVNEKYILTLQDVNYNKLAEVKCAAKDYDKTIKDLILIAEEQLNDNEELIYEAEIAVDKNNKPNFEELKQLGNEVKELLNELEKEEVKLENEVKKEEVKEEPKKEVKDIKVKNVINKVDEFELPLLEEDEGVQYNFEFAMQKEEVKEEPKKEKKLTKVVKTAAKIATGVLLVGVAIAIGKAPIKAAAKFLFNMR